MKRYFYFISLILFVLTALSCSAPGGEPKGTASGTTVTTVSADTTADITTSEITEPVSEPANGNGREPLVFSADGTVISGEPSGDPKTDNFKVYFFNVGRADAALIDADGRYYLIDTGEANTADALCDMLDTLGVKFIDAVFLTHTHSDHIGGFKRICKRLEVGGLFSPEYSILNDLGENKITLLAERYGKENIKLAAGDNVKLCEGVYAEVLGPLEYNGDDDNDNSLVLRVAVNGGVFLFTGDMQFTEEFSLIEAGAELAADVLKVGNHGNKDATSGTFADAVAPEIAVISTDRKINPPSRRIVSLFSKSDVYVTGDYKNWLRVTVAADGTISVD